FAIARTYQFAKLKAAATQAYPGYVPVDEFCPPSNHFRLHGNIRPDSILWIKKGFKLADPDFEKSGRGIAPPLGGMGTYDSPEQSDGDHDVAEPGQAVDVWSLGCVFSLVATWIVLGSPGIVEFDSIRTKARQTAYIQPRKSQDGESAFERNNAFHDDKETLPEVLEWHVHLRSCARKSDRVTGSLLDLLDRRMLIANPASRIKLKELCTLMDGIISQAE
ncbi:MAG: hypothetical protein Q9214_005598, partial [Letrouitia sp. 1 TL-2023]